MYKCPECRHDFFFPSSFFFGSFPACTFFSGCLSYLCSTGLRGWFPGGCFVHCHFLLAFFLSLRLSLTPCCISSPCIYRGSLCVLCLQCQSYTILTGVKKPLSSKVNQRTNFVTIFLISFFITLFSNVIESS